MKILGLSGSLNAASSNTALLHHLRRAVTPPDEVAVYESLDDVPHFSPDREAGPTPAAVAALRTGVADADAVVIATPEYAGGMPGSLKNALDWLVGSGELYGKAVVVVSAAPSEERGGNARAWVEQTVRMQGARVCDSFTIAVPRGQPDDVHGAQAAALLARTRHGLTNGRCAGAV
jgi:chromate reductase